MIHSSEISVVVQGPIHGNLETDPILQYTKNCIESIRRLLPKSEIIVSTWVGEEVTDLDFDTVLFNSDPGAEVFHKRLNIYNNVNRQIVSTFSGVRAAGRRFLLKIRSDMLLKSVDFLNYFDIFPAYKSSYKLLSNRVIISSIFSRNPKKKYCLPYHPSDWFFFGYTEDVLNLWSIPLAPEPETSTWFTHNKYPSRVYWPHHLIRYYPEQYIFTSFIKKYRSLRFDNYADCENDNVAMSEKYLVNNFVILDSENISIEFLKYKINRNNIYSTYTHIEWQELYQKYCDEDYQVDCPAWRRKIFGWFYRFHLITDFRLLQRLLLFLTKRNPNFIDNLENRNPELFSFLRMLFRFFS